MGHTANGSPCTQRSYYIHQKERDSDEFYFGPAEQLTYAGWMGNPLHSFVYPWKNANMIIMVRYAAWMQLAMKKPVSIALIKSDNCARIFKVDVKQ